MLRVRSSVARVPPLSSSRTRWTNCPEEETKNSRRLTTQSSLRRRRRSISRQIMDSSAVDFLIAAATFGGGGGGGAQSAAELEGRFWSRSSERGRPLGAGEGDRLRESCFGYAAASRRLPPALCGEAASGWPWESCAAREARCGVGRGLARPPPPAPGGGEALAPPDGWRRMDVWTAPSAAAAAVVGAATGAPVSEEARAVDLIAKRAGALELSSDTAVRGSDSARGAPLSDAVVEMVPRAQSWAPVSDPHLTLDTADGSRDPDVSSSSVMRFCEASGGMHGRNRRRPVRHARG